jgi:hypothetical protein
MLSMGGQYMSNIPREVNLDQVMASVDESRRAMLKRLLVGSAIFAVPLITTIVKSNDAQAQGKMGGKGKGKKF